MPLSVISALSVRAAAGALAGAESSGTEGPGVAAPAMPGVSAPLPLVAGARLVDAVLADPAVGRAERLVATMPLNDTEMLDRVRQRSGEVAARAAGATKIVEARLVPAPR